MPTLDDEDERTDDESDGEATYPHSHPHSGSDGEPRDDIDFPLDDDTLDLAGDGDEAAGPSSPRRQSNSHPPPRAPYRPRKRRRLQHRATPIRRPSHAHPEDTTLGDDGAGAQFEKELRAELLCEICFGLMWQPVTTPCQHVSPSPPFSLSSLFSPYSLLLSLYLWFGREGTWGGLHLRRVPRVFDSSLCPFRDFAILANVLCTPERALASSLTSWLADWGITAPRPSHPRVFDSSFHISRFWYFAISRSWLTRMCSRARPCVASDVVLARRPLWLASWLAIVDSSQ